MKNIWVPSHLLQRKELTDAKIKLTGAWGLLGNSWGSSEGEKPLIATGEIKEIDFDPHSLLPSRCKWLRGRDLNPRPLGYECNVLVARSFVFQAFVAVRCTRLAILAAVFRPNFRPTGFGAHRLSRDLFARPCHLLSG